MFISTTAITTTVTTVLKSPVTKIVATKFAKRYATDTAVSAVIGAMRGSMFTTTDEEAPFWVRHVGVRGVAPGLVYCLETDQLDNFATPFGKQWWANLKKDGLKHAGAGVRRDWFFNVIDATWVTVLGFAPYGKVAKSFLDFGFSVPVATVKIIKDNVHGIYTVLEYTDPDAYAVKPEDIKYSDEVREEMDKVWDDLDAEMSAAEQVPVDEFADVRDQIDRLDISDEDKKALKKSLKKASKKAAA